MTLLELLILVFAFSGWTLDGISTIWPHENLPEKNSRVVRYFGEFPGLRYFAVKVGTAIFIVLTYPILQFFIGSTEFVLNSVWNVPTPLPIFFSIGVLGWYAFLQNSWLIVQTGRPS